MEYKSVHFNIYNILDIQEDGFQKCLIPNENFDDNFLPGALAKCETNTGEIFVCHIFSLKNTLPKEHCFLDETVQVTSSFRTRIGDKIVKIIQMQEKIVDAKKLGVEIVINNNLFEILLNQNDLIEIVREWLSKFTFYENCAVNGDEFIKSVGIENITVKSDLKEPFQVTSETEVVLNNVFYKEHIPKYSILKGLHNTTEELNKFMEDFNRNKKIYWKVKPSFNALVIGPAGCGKTSICQNLFIENNCNVFNIRPSDIIRQYPGETEEILRKICDNAKHFVKTFKTQFPTIIYIEDIDLLCPAVSESDSYNLMRVSSQIYSILDNFHLSQIDIIIIATTSQIDKVNMQLRRPGRLEKEIQIHTPTVKDREDILRLFLESTPVKNLISDEMILNIAEKTPGFVGADLQLVVENTLQSMMLKKESIEINQEELSKYFENVLKTSKTASIQSTDIRVYKCEETFDEVGGATELKNSLKVSILTPLKKPEIFQKFGLQLPKGILLYGPPGCAKTTVAKCVANETNMTFISISGAEVYSPFVGNAEKYIAKIFDTARRNSPCLIFFDEIETLVGKRTLDSTSDVQTRILSTLLQEMDGIGLKIDEGIKILKNENHILVIGATNRPDMIDHALLRPGRFDKLIHVSAPDMESRLAILELRKRKMPFDNSLNLKSLAEKTEYFSGADLCNLCNEAALYALTRNSDTDFISEDDFNAVLKDLKPSLSKKQIEWYNNFENQYIC